MDRQQKWEAVLHRDERYDRQFVYAVKTTGIYCRPSCPSRKPHFENVEFFVTGEMAKEAGYRPCQRCRPDVDGRVEAQVDLMVDICRYLEQPHEHIPTLVELAERFAMSPYHLQRTFKRVVGVSPYQYADTYRQDRLKEYLKESDTVTDALYAAGYGASSRLYEQSDDMLGMSPITYREGGEAMNIIYTIVPCRLGYLMVAATERGICRIGIGDSKAALASELTAEFPSASIERDEATLETWVTVLTDFIDGNSQVLDLPLDIQATSFQRKVWEALRSIPYGSTHSYQEIAAAIGQPTAARAVAQACAKNPVAMAIPCHRIVRQNGAPGGYRWGIERKKALLRHEKEVVAVVTP